MGDSESIFLTPEEIQILTGYTRKADQRRELQSMGIKFLVNHMGSPIVMKAMLLKRFGASDKGTSMPDFDALEAIENG